MFCLHEGVGCRGTRVTGSYKLLYWYLELSDWLEEQPVVVATELSTQPPDWALLKICTGHSSSPVSIPRAFLQCVGCSASIMS